MSGALLQTPLHALHLELGAKMVPFAGYDMPVQYPAGVMAEHQHVRAKAGLFDVSHMGQLALRARSGDVRDAALALETLVPADMVSLAPGRQRYALLMNKAGGIRDDLMVANMGEWLLLVVNAACKHEDSTYIEAALADRCVLERLEDRALLALQGPGAEAALATLAPAVAAMRFMDVIEADIAGVPCIVSRSGYTGEDGYEIGMASDRADAVARALLALTDVMPIGLGARDSLRLEAGLCLYGSDIDTTTTPVEAALEWSMQKSRKTGGSREGGFPGAETVLAHLAQGASRRRVGLRAEGRAPVRGGAVLFDDAQGTRAIGRVTSGAFGPTAEGPVAMGYVETAFIAPGTTVYAELRGRFVPMQVAAMPFVAPGFKR